MSTQAFKVGDKVTHRSFGAGSIAFGPFKHYSGDTRYLMEQAGGTHAMVTDEALTLAATFKVGDKVKDRYASDTLTIEAGPFMGTGEWYAVRHDGGGVYSAAVHTLVPDSDTETVNGVTYDVSAKYVDQDGDTWSFRRVGGVVRGVYSMAGEDRTADVTEYSATLAQAVSDCGPLTRVTD